MFIIRYKFFINNNYIIIMTTKKNRKNRNTKKKNINHEDDILTDLKRFITSRKLKKAKAKAKAKTLSNNRLNMSGGVQPQQEERKTLEQIEEGFSSLAESLLKAQTSSQQAKADIASITSEIKTKETEIKSANEQAKASKISLISSSDTEKNKFEAFIEDKKKEKTSEARDKVITEMAQKILELQAKKTADEKKVDDETNDKIATIQASIAELQRKRQTAEIAQTTAVQQIQSAEYLKKQYTKAKKIAVKEKAKNDAAAKAEAKAAAKAEAKAAKEKADAKAATKAAAEAAKDA